MRRLIKHISGACPLFLLCLLLNPVSNVLGAPVVVETKTLSSPAADPFVGFVSVGPRHEFETVYDVLEPGACPVLAYRVVMMNYATYDSLVVEELAFSGSGCREMGVRKSWSINGLSLGYALGEGTRFAWNITFRGWERFDTFVISAKGKDFRLQIKGDGEILAHPAAGGAGAAGEEGS